jgi:Zn finger protein HypA/HybF involved in hydrogenase expression
MRCSECGCVSKRARGWIAVLGRDPDDDDSPDELIAFCPVCASREFGMAAGAAARYI